ncbi:MAG TPA: glycoside hydrolase family 28 protein [Thermoanaerobaculia bacterium]|nr:glycoside hydrolase family 28 protein [Thermoanaerobaculia bacterium]
MNRRELIRNAAAATALAAVWPLWSAAGPAAFLVPHPPQGAAGSAALHPAALHIDLSDPWASLPHLLARIQAPTFPNRDFVITRYGARAGRDATGAIRKAVEACSRAGGGRVVIPAGDFLTGAIHLKSRVNLHVSGGATLRFLQDPARYPLVYTRWEGVELMNYSPLVYAFECTDVAVTGEGTLDGQADETHWWPWKGVYSGQRQDVTKNFDVPAPQVADRTQLIRQGEENVPVAQRVYGPGHYLRPPFIETYRCRNVLIQGVTLRNAPFWVTHPTLSTNVTVRGIKVISHGPNNDGCDPESCRDVLIEDCLFDTGDDCIALKSGRNNDGRRVNVPVENVLIRNCEMKEGHGGITMGSEITGGARNIFAEKCRLDSPELERALRMKTNTLRGGIIENVFVRDIEIGTVKLAPIEIDLRYEPRDSGPYIPQVRNILVERMSSKSSRHGVYIKGLENAPVRNVVVRDSQFRGVTHGHVIEGAVQLTLDGVTVEAAPPRKEGTS